MPAYVPTVWVDDDGSNQVGTEFTAARMNKIEQGIANAGTGGGGGSGAGVVDQYAQATAGPMQNPNPPLATWNLFTIPLPPTLVISKSDGTNDDFTRNADGTLTINKTGNFSFSVTLQANANCPDNTNVNALLAKKAGAQPGQGDRIATFNVTTGTNTNNYPTAAVNHTVLCNSGDRIAVYLYYTGPAAAIQWYMQSFSAFRVGGLKGDKGDTGGNATVPMDTWHTVGAAGEPAYNPPWTGTIRFKKDPLGKVIFDGSCTGGTANSVCFTLPVGYRPDRDGYYDCLQGGGGAAYVAINTAGMFVPQVGAIGLWTNGLVLETNTVTAMPTGPQGPKGDKGDSGTTAGYSQPGLWGTQFNPPINTWKTLPVANQPNATYNYPAGAFTWNADGSVTVRDAGWYNVAAGVHVNGNSAYHVTIGVTPDAPGNIAEEYNSTASNVIASLSGATYLPAGSKVYVTIYITTSVQCFVRDFSITAAGVKGDKGDTGGNATAPMEPWRIVGAVGEPAFASGYANFRADNTERASFRKDPLGKVQLRGIVKLLTASMGTIFGLPSGYVEGGGTTTRFCCTSAKGPTFVQIVNGFVSHVAVSGFATLTTGDWLDLSGVEFDTDTVTAMPTGPAGPVGPQGPPGNSTTVPMDGFHVVGQPGEPAFGAGWGAWTTCQFRKDPLGRVAVTGTVRNTVAFGFNGTNNTLFTLPAGYRPAFAIDFPVTVFEPDGSTASICQARCDTDGTVKVISRLTGATTSGGVGSFVKFDEILFDTGLVTAMPTGPKGDKGDSGLGLLKTLNWNTALAPGFYYGGQFGLEGNTANSPGDQLNIEDQAGIVSIKDNMVVQRVYTLTTQRGWTRYRLYDGTWTAWVGDLVVPATWSEPLAGGFAPSDGDERDIQTADMATRGERWRFRYRKTSALVQKWEFIGGSDVFLIVNGMNANAGGTVTDPGVALVMPFGGMFDVTWGARMYQNPSSPAGSGNVLLHCDLVRAGNIIATVTCDIWVTGLPNQSWSTVVPTTHQYRFTVLAGDTLRLRSQSTTYNAALERPSMRVRPVAVNM